MDDPASYPRMHILFYLIVAPGLFLSVGDKS